MKIDILKLINIFKKTNIFWAGALIIFITSCSSNGKDEGKSFIFELEEGDPINASPPLSSQVARASLISLADSPSISDSEIVNLKFDDLYIPEEQYFSKLVIDESGAQEHKQEIGIISIFSDTKPATELDKYAKSFVGGVIRVFAAGYSQNLARVYAESKDAALSESYFSVGGIHNNKFSARIRMPVSGKTYIVFYLMDYISTIDQLLAKDPDFSVDPKVGLLAEEAAELLGDSFKPGHIGSSAVIDLRTGALDEKIGIVVHRNDAVFVDGQSTKATAIIPLMSHGNNGGKTEFSNFAIDENDKRHMIGYSINLSKIAKDQGDNNFVFTSTKNAEGKFEWPYGYIKMPPTSTTGGSEVLTRKTIKYDVNGKPLKYQNVKWNSGANANAYSTWKCVVRTAYDGEETIWDISSTSRTLQGSANSVCNNSLLGSSSDYTGWEWRNSDKFDVNGLALGDLEHKMNYFLPTADISIKDYDNHAGIAVYGLSSNNILEKTTGQTAKKFVYIYDYKGSNIKVTNKGSKKEAEQFIFSGDDLFDKSERDGTANAPVHLGRSNNDFIGKRSMSQIVPAVNNNYGVIEKEYYFAVDNKISSITFDINNQHNLGLHAVVGRTVHDPTKGIFGEDKGKSINRAPVTNRELNFQDITGLAFDRYNNMLYVTDGRNFIAKIHPNDSYLQRATADYLFVWNDANDDDVIDYDAPSTASSVQGKETKKNKVVFNKPTQLVIVGDILYVLDVNKVLTFSISNANNNNENVAINTVRAYPNAIGGGVQAPSGYYDNIFSIGKSENGIFLTAGDDEENIFVYYYKHDENCNSCELAATRVTNKKLDAGTSQTFVVSNPIRLDGVDTANKTRNLNKSKSTVDSNHVGGYYMVAYAGALHAFDLNGYVERTEVDFPERTTSLALYQGFDPKYGFVARTSNINSYKYEYTHFLTSTFDYSNPAERVIGDVVISVKQ
ncbi:MAG: hypothetical protein JJV97_05560 [SAR324 cluster bacterium]|nr:hypothetical protein [SAR324 cluster bacterium]